MNEGSHQPLLRSALVACGVWAAVVLFSSSQLVLNYSSNGYPTNWGLTLTTSALQWLPWLFLAPLVLVLVRKAPLRKGNWLRGLFVHLVTLLVLALFIVAASFQLRAMGGSPIKRTFAAEYMRSVHSIAVVYGMLVAAAHGLAALRRTRERERDVARLEAQLAEARLATLQAQLHPHFLFNTLHGISSLVHEDPDAAEDMLTALSDLLRLTLGRGDRREIHLREEMAFLERYLEIHAMRLGPRLRVSISVPPDMGELLVPSFVLQPLVENSIKHAIAPRRAGGHLEIRAERMEGAVRLTVLDDGPGLAATADAPSGSLGLRNTRARLHQMYGDEQTFSVGNRPEGGTAATIVLPIRTDGSSAAAS